MLKFLMMILNKAALATSEVIAIMKEMGGFVDITDSRPLPGIEWTIQIDRDKAARHGVSIADIGTYGQNVNKRH